MKAKWPCIVADTNAYSIMVANTNAMHAVSQMSIALGYDTFGLAPLDPDS